MKKRVILSNDGVEINLNSIIGFLNDISNYFVFEIYPDDIAIDDAVITPKTYSKLNLKVSNDIYFIMIFTDKQYYNNYFFDPDNNVVIASFFGWEYLTNLHKSNGAAYFVADYLTLRIDSSFRHTLDGRSKPECMFDFLQDKTGIDSGMRSALICPQCNDRIKSNIRSENDKYAFEDIKSILNEIGNASKWDEELTSYWKRKKPLYTQKDQKKSVFVSYSHADSEWLKRVKVHLKPLERNSIIEIWEDTRIQTGDKWKEEIEKALANSHAAILLVSADFLASDFIIENELPQLLKLAQEQGTRIFQVIISPCCFDETEQLSQFQAVNSASKTLIEMDRGDQERLLLQLAKNILSHVNRR